MDKKKSVVCWRRKENLYHLISVRNVGWHIPQSVRLTHRTYTPPPYLPAHKTINVLSTFSSFLRHHSHQCVSSLGGVGGGVRLEFPSNATAWLLCEKCWWRENRVCFHSIFMPCEVDPREHQNHHNYDISSSRSSAPLLFPRALTECLFVSSYERVSPLGSVYCSSPETSPHPPPPELIV